MTHELVFLVATYNRHELMCRSLSSLVRSRLPQGTLLLFIDDHSSESRNVAFLRSLDTGHYEKAVVCLPQRTGRPFHVFNAGLSWLGEQGALPEATEWFGWGDPDMLYAPNWFQEGRARLEHVEREGLCEHVRALGYNLAAGFTTLWLGARPDRHRYQCSHSSRDSDKSAQDYCIKLDMPWLNAVMRGNAFARVGPFPATRRPEAVFGEKMQRAQMCVVGTIPSYVQHIGYRESALFHHRRQVGDFAIDFAGDLGDEGSKK